jgi:hypothetical protein
VNRTRHTHGPGLLEELASSLRHHFPRRTTGRDKRSSRTKPGEGQSKDSAWCPWVMQAALVD